MKREREEWEATIPYCCLGSNYLLVLGDGSSIERERERERRIRNGIWVIGS